MTWPLEAEGVREFAQGLDEILVVEEKRQILEYALKEELYNWRDDVRPRVVGKFDDTGEWSNHHHEGHGDWLLPATYELSPAQIARAIASRISRYFAGHPIEQKRHPRAHRLPGGQGGGAEGRRAGPVQGPHSAFLLGLPAQHLDQGAGRQPRAGRHRLPLHGAVDGPRDRHLHPHGRRRRNLDRRGALHQRKARVRQSGRRHLLPLGHLAIRAAVAAKVNITYKILYNDAVAMTGGQNGGRPDRPGDDLAPAGGRGRLAHHRGDRRPGQIPGRRQLGARRHDTPSQRTRRGAARAARDAGRVGHDL
jgi:indolepyruvate ferredoxin oxidoreductase